MKEKYEIERKVGKAIEMVWVSLESHLLTPYYMKRAILAGIKNKKVRIIKDDLRFHQQCVREYADLIRLIADLY